MSEDQYPWVLIPERRDSINNSEEFETFIVYLADSTSHFITSTVKGRKNMPICILPGLMLLEVLLANHRKHNQPKLSGHQY